MKHYAEIWGVLIFCKYHKGKHSFQEFMLVKPGPCPEDSIAHTHHIALALSFLSPSLPGCFLSLGSGEFHLDKLSDILVLYLNATPFISFHYFLWL